MKTIFRIIAIVFLILALGTIGGIEGGLVPVIVGMVKALVYLFGCGVFAFLGELNFKKSKGMHK